MGGGGVALLKKNARTFSAISMNIRQLRNARFEATEFEQINKQKSKYLAPISNTGG
jgi:hypothetical protein